MKIHFEYTCLLHANFENESFTGVLNLYYPPTGKAKMLSYLYLRPFQGKYSDFALYTGKDMKEVYAETIGDDPPEGIGLKENQGATNLKFPATPVERFGLLVVSATIITTQVIRAKEGLAKMRKVNPNITWGTFDSTASWEYDSSGDPDAYENLVNEFR